VPPRRTRTVEDDLPALQREINLLFERLSAFDRSEPTAGGEWIPSVDVFERDGALVVVAEVPGLGPESLRAAIRDDALVLSGERRAKRPAVAGTYLCLERPNGRFTRTIPLERALDVRRASARLKDGLLIITIPRRDERRGRETLIPIEREPESS
jgi:HSP20 family protein